MTASKFQTVPQPPVVGERGERSTVEANGDHGDTSLCYLRAFPSLSDSIADCAFNEGLLPARSEAVFSAAAARLIRQLENFPVPSELPAQIRSLRSMPSADAVKVLATLNSLALESPELSSAITSVKLAVLDCMIDPNKLPSTGTV